VTAPLKRDLMFLQSHTCAIKSGDVDSFGVAYCWGSNDSGQVTTHHWRLACGLCSLTFFLPSQLGDNSQTPSTIPVPVFGSPKFRALSSGGVSVFAHTWAHICCLHFSATRLFVLFWLMQLTLLNAQSHTCAINSTGALLCWGLNTNGQVIIIHRRSSHVKLCSCTQTHRILFYSLILCSLVLVLAI
jgi:hypothetical protein